MGSSPTLITMKKEYNELIDSIKEIYLGMGQDRVNLGIDGETFYIREKISLEELFLKDDRLYVSIEDKERRIDDFTTDTLINIKQKLSV